MNGIQILKNLKSLILRKNSLTKIDLIDEILNLNFLDISFNKIRVIDRGNIGILPNLKSLSCDGNFLKNVNAFSKFITLNYLSLENNKIFESAGLDRLIYLENLLDLNISNNSICKMSGYRLMIIRKFPSLIKKIDVNRSN